MPIINIAHSSKLIAHSLKILFLCFCFILIAGCSQKNELQLAQECVGKSEVYYQHSVERYKKLIREGKDLDRLHFELGRLYYSRGDFNRAQEELKKANYLPAKKLLAISLYRLGNFVDALEIFNKAKISEDEFLYYQGLTSEKLNLFDQALVAYKQIKGRDFSAKAKERKQTIEKEVKGARIKDVDPQVYQILASGPSAKEFPQAGALILSCDENISVTNDGKEISTLHYLVKILNERGKEDFSETHIDYDSTFEKVELEYARTIKPDGTVVEVGSRHIRDVSKYLNFPLYSNARVYIISFPEITEGSVIEYKVKIYNNQLINKKDFVLGYSVQAQEPIIAAKFSVSLPKDRPLHIKVINDKYNDFAANLIPIREEKEGFLVYSWQFKEIPQIIPESNMPPSVEINPALLLSTFNNWQDIYQWWWNLARDKIKPDSAIKNQVKELIKGAKQDEEKIRSIYNFCAKDIRYVAVEYGQAGYEPHAAGDIFKNKYGDCKDQAILLVTMLKEAGLLASPVLIATKEDYNLNQDFPAVLFNHCIAGVILKGKLVFLDPTAQTCSFGDLPPDDQKRKVLICKESGYEIQETPLFTARHNLVKQRLEIRVNNDESMVAEKSNFTFGFYDQAQRYWLLYTQPELIRQALNEKINEVSIGAKLDKYEIENLDDLNKPVILSYAFSGPEYFTCAGLLRIMPQLASLDTSLVAREKRKYPLYFGVLDNRETYFEIEIPKGFVIKYMPESIAEESLWLKFVAQYISRGQKISFVQKIGLKKIEISENEYSDFKIFLENLAKKIKQRIVLERVR